MDGWALSMTGTMDFAAPEVLQDESPSEWLGFWKAEGSQMGILKGNGAESTFPKALLRDD